VEVEVGGSFCRARGAAGTARRGRRSAADRLTARCACPCGRAGAPGPTRSSLRGSAPATDVACFEIVMLMLMYGRLIQRYSESGGPNLKYCNSSSSPCASARLNPNSIFPRYFSVCFVQYEVHKLHDINILAPSRVNSEAEVNKLKRTIHQIKIAETRKRVFIELFNVTQ
jgi:hypothetical protein